MEIPHFYLPLAGMRRPCMHARPHNLNKQEIAGHHIDSYNKLSCRKYLHMPVQHGLNHMPQPLQGSTEQGKRCRATDLWASYGVQDLSTCPSLRLTAWLVPRRRRWRLRSR